MSHYGRGEGGKHPGVLGMRVVGKQHHFRPHGVRGEAGRRHCEERSDEAIQNGADALDCFARLATTQAPSFPRCPCIRVLPHQAIPSCPPLKKGGRAPKDAPPGTAPFQVRRALSSIGGGALAFRRPTAVSETAVGPLGLGLSQRFLESPDANGRTLSGTSAASTSQTGSRPDRHDAKAARERNVSFRSTGTAPAPHSGVPSRKASFVERDFA
jgi:hypothetical protein